MGCRKLSYYQGPRQIGKNHFFIGAPLEKRATEQFFCNGYYPFGLPIAQNNYEEPGNTENRFLYQGKEWQTALALNLYDFHARQYDPAIGRFTGVDPQGQFASGYVGMGNNPAMGIDPDGEWFGVDDLIAGAIGGVINLGVNIFQGNISGTPWEVLGQSTAAFTAGAAAGTLALYGPGGWAAGGAIVGGTNAWLGGATSASDIAIGAGIGAATSLVGGAIGQGLSPAISGWTSGIGSPALQGAAGGAIGGAITGAALGGTMAALTGNDVWGGIGKGALLGGVAGGIAGGVAAGAHAQARGFNAFSGKRTAAWLAKNPSLNSLHLKPAAIGDIKSVDLPENLPGPIRTSSSSHSKLQGNTSLAGEFGGKMQYVSSPNGKTVAVPANYVPSRADNGNGVVYRPPGSTGNANSIRIMGPTQRYPNGYVRYYNSSGQPVNSYGKPGPQSETHFPF